MLSWLDVKPRNVASWALTPPRLPTDVLHRPRLEDRLGPTDGARVSLVTGATGYGKTTLVRQWAERQTSPWAWITVERSVAAAVDFWPLMVQAAQSCFADVTLDVVDTIGDDTASTDEIAHRLVADLAFATGRGRSAIVVVDDAHLLAAATWEHLEWAIQHLPDSFHLVLISRVDPPFPTARARTLGWVREVREGDLGFLREEIDALVDQASAGSHDDEWAERLFRRTEGWPTGVALALRSAAGGGTLAESPPLAGGLVSELLITEVLAQQPPALRRFLLKTSVATMLTPELCDVLTGTDDARSMLRELARRHVFVTEIDDAPDQYRYHPIFADVLRIELRATGPTAETEQHRRAAQWYESEGRYGEAIDHAIAGADHDLALSLIARHMGQLLTEGERRDVARLLLEFPADFAATNADRAVAYCGALLTVTDPAWLVALRRAKALTPPDRPDLQARLATFSAMRTAGQGNIDAFRELVDLSHTLRPPGVVEPFDEVVEAWHARLELLHGEPAAALERAERAYRGTRHIVRELAATSLLALTRVANRAPDAESLLDDVVAEWRRSGEPDISGIADGLSAASGRALHAGDVDEAENLAAGAMALTAERPTHLLGVYAEVAMARVEQVTGRVDVARRRLADLRSRVIETGATAPVVRLIDDALRPPLGSHETTRRSPLRLVEDLTDRELIILRSLAGHQTFPEIGRELHISRHTVKTHAMRIYRKLNVHGRSAAIREATRVGLL